MKKKRPTDVNQLAKSVVGIATGEVDDKESELTTKRRKAGKRGSKARAKALSPEQRSEIARLAAQARWEKRD